MTDLLREFNEPAVMDIKMGTRSVSIPGRLVVSPGGRVLVETSSLYLQEGGCGIVMVIALTRRVVLC